MHALMQVAQPQNERFSEQNGVRIKSFRGGFPANSLKHLIMPNCFEDRTHTEAISNDMHGQLFTRRQHLGKRITKYNVCTFHNTELNYVCK